MKIMDREKILENIRKIIGSKSFKFSDAYRNKCGNNLTIGKNGKRYCYLTKKYLYISCWGRYVYDEAEKMYGWDFCKYPILKNSYGENITKVPLEELFTKDLEKLLNDIRFYLWWEKNVRFPSLKKEYEECKKIVTMLEKNQHVLEETNE